MFLVRATEASKTKAVQVLTRIEESALLTHQLKLAYFVHIVESEANLAEFEVFWGKLYERTVLYIQLPWPCSNPIYPEFTLKCPYCPKYPRTLQAWQQMLATRIWHKLP